MADGRAKHDGRDANDRREPDCGGATTDFVGNVAGVGTRANNVDELGEVYEVDCLGKPLADVLVERPVGVNSYKREYQRFTVEMLIRLYRIEVCSLVFALHVRRGCVRTAHVEVSDTTSTQRVGMNKINLE